MLFLIEKIIVVLITVLSGGLGLLVLLSNKTKRINQLFALVSFLIILWVNFAFFSFKSQISKRALIFYRLNWGVVSLFLLTYYYFYIIHFLKINNRAKLIGKIFIVLSAFFCVISLSTDLIVKEVLIKNWGTEIIFGNLNVFFNSYVFLVAIVILYYTLIKYSSLSDQIRAKLPYFLTGFFIFLLANIIFNVISPYLFDTVRYQHFGDYSTIFFIAFTGYAIVKRELFGIKVLMTELLVGTMGIILFILPFVAPTTWFKVVLGLNFIIFCLIGSYLIKNVRKREKNMNFLEEEVQKGIKELKVRTKDLENFVKWNGRVEELFKEHDKEK